MARNSSISTRTKTKGRSKRREKELLAKVKLPAEAEAYKVQVIAEGRKTQVPANEESFVCWRRSKN